MAFTDAKIRALRPRRTRYELPEGGRTGLLIRVSPYGAKTWAVRYRYRGRQKRLAIGSYPELSLVDARGKLAGVMKQLRDGRDPGVIALDARQAIQTAPTVDELVQEYLTRHAQQEFRPATVREDRRILEKEILPSWRGRLAKDITRRDVITILNAIADRGVYVQRNRVAGVLSRLFIYALDAGIVDSSPAVHLPRLKKVGSVKVELPRSRFLSKDEIRSFWKNVESIPISPSMKCALKWLLLTGQRRSETALAARCEIADDLWTIPGTRTKNEQEQLLPLPALALDVLKEADLARIRPAPTRLNRKDRRPYDAEPSPWLFPSVRYGQPITPAALTCAVVRHRDALRIGDATIHDLRRTFATWLGEIGIPKDVISALLNHAPKGITDQHYNHATMLEPKRRAMQTWSNWLEKVIAGDAVTENVLPLRRVRREIS